VARVMLRKGAGSVAERRAQVAYRRFVTLAGRLDACNPITHVGAWDDLVIASELLADACSAARESALESARVVTAARRTQLSLLPPGTVVEAAERGPERVCAHCESVFFGEHCLGCYRRETA
jgi:hypothetical protein